MSESDRPLDAETQRPEHDDPFENNDLLPSPAEPAPDRSPETTTDEAPAEQPALAPASAPRPRDPTRRLLPIGWALVVVLIAFAVLMVIGLQRVSSELSNLQCVERAQADYNSITGSKANSSATQLARLGLQIALRKCGT